MTGRVAEALRYRLGPPAESCRTNLTSIDPTPRFAIDRLCDTIVQCYFASSHPRLGAACDRVVSRAGADKARSSSFWFGVTSCNRQ